MTSVLTYVGGQPPKFTSVEQAEAWMKDALVPARYRVTLHQSEEPVDIGDWLPQDREHYERVGPFRIDGKDVDWDTWWGQPDGSADVGNWVSFYMTLERWCADCNTWSDTDEALHGLDYFENADPDLSPINGQMVLLDQPWPDTLDPYLKEVASDLVAQDQHTRRNRKQATA